MATLQTKTTITIITARTFGWSESTDLSSSSTISPAPVIHVATSGAGLLIDYPHGEGHIILLADPFIVANGGIGLKDNLQLTINLLASSDGLIAFDEFHQGRGATHNAFASYFAGTPVLAIFGQLVLIIILILWTRGRRFAGPLPLRQVDRRSSMEFVASRLSCNNAKAFDLAMKIFTRERGESLRVMPGWDYNSPRAEIAARGGPVNARCYHWKHNAAVGGLQ